MAMMGQATYTCKGCGKLTHFTGWDEWDYGVCLRCWKMVGDNNAVSDGRITAEEFKARWGINVEEFRAMEYKGGASNGVQLRQRGH